MLFDFIKKIFSGRRRFVEPEKAKLIQADFKSIDAMLKTGTPSQLRNCLINADKALDFALKDLFDGETMAERLKNAKSKFSPDVYDKIWSAHKLRNALVHEVGLEPQHFLLKSSVEGLRKGLKELGVKV